MAKRTKEQDNEQGQGQTAYNPFLKADDVTAVAAGEAFSITQGFTRRKPGRFGEQIIMEVVRKRDGKTFDFAIGVGSINHRIMARRQGDEQRWHGTLMLAKQDGQRSPFVAIVTDENDPPF